jgi:hypothetical protein
MLQAAEPLLTRSSSRLAAASLGGLAATQAMVGAWALMAPANFFAHFPTAAQAWVALLPPYNEHLVRDVGALSLALAALLGAAALVRSRLLIQVAALAFATYALPHTAFHALHLEGFERADAVAQMAGLVVQLAVVAIALATTLGPRRVSSPSVSP